MPCAEEHREAALSLGPRVVPSPAVQCNAWRCSRACCQAVLPRIQTLCTASFTAAGPGWDTSVLAWPADEQPLACACEPWKAGTIYTKASDQVNTRMYANTRARPQSGSSQHSNSDNATGVQHSSASVAASCSTTRRPTYGTVYPLGTCQVQTPSQPHPNVLSA